MTNEQEERMLRLNEGEWKHVGAALKYYHGCVASYYYEGTETEHLRMMLPVEKRRYNHNGSFDDYNFTNLEPIPQHSDAEYDELKTKLDAALSAQK